MEKYDIVIIMGGVFVGDFDYLFEIYKVVKVEVLFNKVVMCFGSVIMVVFVDGKYLFGLFGNLLVCFIGFELFVKLVVKYMCGVLEVFL